MGLDGLNSNSYEKLFSHNWGGGQSQVYHPEVNFASYKLGWSVCFWTTVESTGPKEKCK